MTPPTPTPKKKLFIKTWGCQMNVYDSRRMEDVLAPLGYAPVTQAEGADMVILNTCHIREKATEKVFSDLGRLREYKLAHEKTGGKMIIAVAGCVAQAEGEVIAKRAPYVDMVFGPQTYHELPQMVLRAGGERVISTDFPVESKFDHLPGEQAGHGPSAFLSIQEGCDKFCTFCVVPYTRGAEYSRDAAGILDEAKRLRDKGAKEITLLGQNVNAFHGVGPDGQIWGLGRLIAAIAEIDGVERIRYMTSHPRDMDDELIDAHGAIPKLMPFLHLPVQSGSDAILKAMNRQHTGDHYRDIIARVRKARPDIGLSSDFIVGFPGETDRDFEDTLQLVRDIGFSSCYAFKYSRRPGTPAAAMQGLLSEKVKTERLARLQELLNDQHRAFNARMVGMTVPVLFDRVDEKRGQLHGRTGWMQAVHVAAPPALCGTIAEVRVTRATATALSGDISAVQAA